MVGNVRGSSPAYENVSMVCDAAAPVVCKTDYSQASCGCELAGSPKSCLNGQRCAPEAWRLTKPGNLKHSKVWGDDLDGLTAYPGTCQWVPRDLVAKEKGQTMNEQCSDNCWQSYLHPDRCGMAPGGKGKYYCHSGKPDCMTHRLVLTLDQIGGMKPAYRRLHNSWPTKLEMILENSEKFIADMGKIDLEDSYGEFFDHIADLADFSKDFKLETIKPLKAYSDKILKFFDIDAKTMCGEPGKNDDKKFMAGNICDSSDAVGLHDYCMRLDRVFCKWNTFSTQLFGNTFVKGEKSVVEGLRGTVNIHKPSANSMGGEPKSDAKDPKIWDNVTANKKIAELQSAVQDYLFIKNIAYGDSNLEVVLVMQTLVDQFDFSKDCATLNCRVTPVTIEMAHEYKNPNPVLSSDLETYSTKYEEKITANNAKDDPEQMLAGFGAYRDDKKVTKMEADLTVMRVYLNTGETDVTYTYFGDWTKGKEVEFKVTIGLGDDAATSTKTLKILGPVDEPIAPNSCDWTEVVKTTV
jgi:hypothetical protein